MKSTRQRRLMVEALEPRLCLSAPQLVQRFPLPQEGSYTASPFAASPLIADLDGDGKGQETLVAAAGGRLLALKTDANGHTSIWRQYLTGNTAYNFKATPVIVDLPNGHKGIFAAQGRDELYLGNGLGEPGLVFGWDAQTGQLLPGWPKDQGRNASNQFEVGAFGALGSGDIDGDGQPEILVTSHSTYLSAFKLDGTLLWRFENDDTIETGPVVGDLDGDGKNEVVFTSGISRSFVADGGFMTILNGNGSARSRTFVGEVFYTSPALADLNGDGKLEIIASTSSFFDQKGVPGALAAGNRVYAFDYRGKILPGWPYHTTSNDTLRRQSYASPVVADLNGDFQLEVVNVDQSGVVHVIQANGQPFPGWAGGRPILNAPDDDPNGPLKAFGTPIIADVDGDSKADIVVGQAFKLVAFNLQGQKIFQADTPVIPGQVPEFIITSVAVGNLDNSGGLDMVLLTHNSNANRPGTVSIYHLDPSGLTPPWPMQRRSANANAVRQSLPYLADFVRGSYRAFLGREPSTSEFLFQVYALEANTYTPQQLARALSQTNESRGHVVDEMYRQYLDRAPSPAERAYVAAQLAIRRQRDMILVLVNTGEFFQKSGLSVEGVIARLYQRIIGRLPTQAETASAIQLAIRTKSLVPIGDALLNTPEAIIRQAQSVYQAAFGSANIAPDAQAALVLDQHAGRREEDINTAILFSHGNYAATNAQAGYIRTLYRDLLNREASPLEVGNLLRLFDAGTLNQGALARFLLSTGEAKALFVREAFRTYLGRDASPEQVAALSNYARREDVILFLTNSPEYFNRAGGTNLGFLQAAFRDIADIYPVPPSFFDSLVRQLDTGTPRSSVLSQLLSSGDYYNKIVVNDLYRYLPDESMGFLRNGPLPMNDPRVPINPDPNLVRALVNALQNGAREDDVIFALVTSAKYVNNSSYYKGFYISRSLRS